MARSTAIYVVISKEDGLPVAGFTVKHELESWAQVRSTNDYRFFRIKDGLRWQETSPAEIFYPFDRKTSSS